MEISLINGYYIEVDQRNCTLRRRYYSKGGDGEFKERKKIISHCGSLKQAVDTFLRINQVPPEAKMSVDLLGYVKLVEESNKRAVSQLHALISGKENG